MADIDGLLGELSPRLRLLLYNMWGVGWSVSRGKLRKSVWRTTVPYMLTSADECALISFGILEEVTNEVQRLCGTSLRLTPKGELVVCALAELIEALSAMGVGLL